VTVVVVVRALRASPKRKTNLRERAAAAAEKANFQRAKNLNFQKQKHKKRG
jgi:antitoxin component of MazEF toxin-antitoxin module